MRATQEKVGWSLLAHSAQALQAEGDEAGDICSAQKGHLTKCRDDVLLGPRGYVRSSRPAGPRPRHGVLRPPRDRNKLQTVTFPRDRNTLQAVTPRHVCRSHCRGCRRRLAAGPGGPGRIRSGAAPTAQPPPPLQEKTTQTCLPGVSASGPAGRPEDTCVQ